MKDDSETSTRADFQNASVVYPFDHIFILADPCSSVVFLWC